MRGALLSGAVAAMRARVGAWRRHRYLQSLSAARYAPYPTRLYRDFLARALHDRALEVAPFVEAPAGRGLATLYVRHDIDTAACARGMGLLLGIDRELGVRSGVYLLADAPDYRLSDLREEIAAWRAAGFEVGLHTACYAHDDCFAAFAAETWAFTNALGFAPRSFTVHGLGQHRLDARMKFYREIPARLTEFGYAYTDIPGVRGYDHVFEDCHWDDARQARYVRDDLAGRRYPYARGGRYLLLTHPCYWTP
jgi:hypothetical protein